MEMLPLLHSSHHHTALGKNEHLLMHLHPNKKTTGSVLGLQLAHSIEYELMAIIAAGLSIESSLHDARGLG